MFPECSLNVPWMWWAPPTFLLCWCSQVVPWMFPQCSLNVPSMFSDSSLNVPWMFLDFLADSSPHGDTHTVLLFCRFLAHIPLIIMMEALCDWTRSSTPGIRRLVLLTLVLGTHVCKLYSASTLVPLSASCSWDGGSRAPAQLKLNVPCVIPECALNIPWMFPECSLDCSLIVRCLRDVLWEEPLH
jgi:hypothetical protein